MKVPVLLPIEPGDHRHRVEYVRSDGDHDIIRIAGEEHRVPKHRIVWITIGGNSGAGARGMET